MGVGRSLGHPGIMPGLGKSGVPVVRCRPLGGRSGPPARPPEVSWSDSSESLAARQLANRVLRAGSDAGEEDFGGGDVSPSELVRRLCSGSASTVRRAYASPDQASSLAPRALNSRAVPPNSLGEPREGAEGGTRTRTARRPLAPQGFVCLPRASLLFPSVSAPTSAKSDAKASAQRPAKCRPSVANRRHINCKRWAPDLWRLAAKFTWRIGAA